MPAKRTVSDDLTGEAASLAREVARDSIEASRLAWRTAARMGRFGLRWAEKVAKEMGEALDDVGRKVP